MASKMGGQLNVMHSSITVCDLTQKICLKQLLTAKSNDLTWLRFRVRVLAIVIPYDNEVAKMQGMKVQDLATGQVLHVLCITLFNENFYQHVFQNYFFIKFNYAFFDHRMKTEAISVNRICIVNARWNYQQWVNMRMDYAYLSAENICIHW